MKYRTFYARMQGGVREMQTKLRWANYFKIMQFFLPETEFTPLILTSKSVFSYELHFYKNFKLAPRFSKFCIQACLCPPNINFSDSEKMYV